MVQGQEVSIMRGWRILAIVPVATMLVTGSALAQDDAVEDTGGSRVVAPEECTNEPRTFDDLATILDLNGEGLSAPERTQITPPLGEIVDPDTATTIDEAAREIVACFNAGDIPRAAALMTDNGVQRVYWGLSSDEENRDLAKTRLPEAPEPRAADALIRLIAVTDASTLRDGRVAAFAVISEPLLPPNGPETLLFIFANQDGTWLLDDMVDFSVVPVGATQENADA
jgi:hypothetical protein